MTHTNISVSEPLGEEENEEFLYEHHHIICDKGQASLRIDKFLQARLEGISRSKIQAAAEAGCILVNDKVVKQNYKIKGGDDIKIVFSKPRVYSEVRPENIPLNVLYEDESLLVVNKPAGLVVHPGVGNYTGTLVNGLLYHVSQLPEVQNMNPESPNYPRPGLVHRIDKNTTGLLVVGKNERSLDNLVKQFFDRTVDKIYIALVWGNVVEDEGTIVGNIDRHERYRKLFAVYPADGEKGKPAVTHYKVLKRFGYVTLVQVKLETGRTHQIRVHMKHIGHTLFNDDTYDGNRVVKGPNHNKYKQFVQNCFDLIPSQALHAQSLSFTHPVTGERMTFEAELPDGFKKILEKWETYSLAVKPVIEDEDVPPLMD